MTVGVNARINQSNEANQQVCCGDKGDLPWRQTLASRQQKREGEPQEKGRRGGNGLDFQRALSLYSRIVVGMLVFSSFGLVDMVEGKVF